MKTPLQIVVGDRHLSTTDTDSDVAAQFKSSSSSSANRKVSMASTCATVSMQHTRESGVGTPGAVKENRKMKGDTGQCMDWTGWSTFF